ncbi:MAG: site-specific integrase [Syntrophobacteraceae bacterium]|jgi:integrase
MKEISRRTKAKGDLPGSIYLRGKVYWIKYYKDGKPYRESTRSEDYDTAQAELAKRINEVTQGKTPNIEAKRIKFDDLSKDFLSDYRINGRKSLERAEISTNHLKVFFSGTRVTEISTSKIQEYIEKRMEEKAANGTINRELAALKRMLHLGARHTPPKVDRVPYVPMLKENNVRKGFFEPGDFIAFRDKLPEYLKGFATFAYKTGWRKTEICNLEWKQVDLKRATARLNPGETKNDGARVAYLDSELITMLESTFAVRKKAGIVCPYVFPNESGTGPIKDIRGSWYGACQAAGIGRKLLHDCRRTAVRNMIRSANPEVVVMAITGHKTRAVFDRYNIVNEADLALAASRQEAYLKAAMGTKTGTILDLKERQSS